VSREVLTLRREACPVPSAPGAWTWDGWEWSGEWTWLPRAQAEQDERYLQVIPYAVLRNAENQLWCYRREGGDDRLRDRFSCGVGGHIDRADEAGGVAEMASGALGRELYEELGWNPPLQTILPDAWIYEGISAIGRVHIGLLYVLPWSHGEPPRAVDDAIADVGFLTPERVIAEPRFELWSRLAARFIHGDGT